MSIRGHILGKINHFHGELIISISFLSQNAFTSQMELSEISSNLSIAIRLLEKGIKFVFLLLVKTVPTWLPS